MWWLLWLACSDPLRADADGDRYLAVTDCDDHDPDVHPDAEERCDPPGRDENCDGDPEGPEPVDGISGWIDGDGDGWGGKEPSSSCDPDAVVARSGDCDDADPDVSPGAVEVCDDGIRDEDCDGQWLWYVDLDGDGYGVGSGFPDCSAAAQVSGDCDDGDPGISPAAAELCGNGIDDDCDRNALPCAFEGEVETVDAVGWLPGLPLASGDLDGDGFLDLVTGPTDETSGLRIFLGPFDVGAAPDLVIEGRGTAAEAVLLDLDGDGILDLVSAAAPMGTLRVEVRYGPLGLAADAAWEVETSIREVEAAGDTDGDGRAEVVVRTGAGTFLIQGRPVGSSLSEVASVEFAGWAGAVGDVDGDGLADLGIFGESDCNFGVVLGPFGPRVLASQAVACRDASGAPPVDASGVGDVDGDGLDDLVVSFYEPNYGAWLLPGGALGEGPLGASQYDAYGAHRIGDLDADGVDDLLTYRKGWYRLFPSAGPPATFRVAGGWSRRLDFQAVPAADYDGDGRSDLLLGEPDTARTWWFSASGERW